MSDLGQPGVGAPPDQIQQVGQASTEVSEIFEGALDIFVGNLSQSEQKFFVEHKDAESVVAAIATIAEKHPVHQSRLTAACRKFQHLVSRLQPYFDVVETFVQVKPEYMAIIWGSLKMIFKLSSNYISFLDKMADMFGNIADHLPAYGEYIATLQQRAAERGENYTRLAKALGYFYTDILGFCYSAYALFANKKHGFKAKLSFVSRLVWQPFDIRYDTLVSRIKQHTDLLDLELRWASTNEAIVHFRRYEGWFIRNQKLDTAREEKEKAMERTHIWNRVKELKKWISPPQWTERLEEAQEKRTPGTGVWILENKIYQTWKRFDRKPGLPPESRILTLRGKVGYGKTVLCSLILDDLGSYAHDADSAAIHTDYSVVFYFFDKRRSDANTPIDAIRAMLAQLIHLHRSDKFAVDAASVIFKRDATGQLTASSKEVIAVLEMLLSHLKFTYLVLDAFDECSDSQKLLDILGKITEKSTTSALLLIGRPSVQLPANFDGGSARIDLEPDQLQHSNDMMLFLRPSLQRLPDELLFSELLDLDQTSNEIMRRAGGMFLWAKLLVDYLALPSFSTQDRVDIINNLYRLPDLDSLYLAILANLESRFPGASINSVSRIFQLVAYACRPLTLTELHHAISVPFRRRQTCHDLLPSFKESLGSLSGSLIELSRDGRTRFIHASTQEYFLEMSFIHGQDATSSRLLTDRELANRNIAASCLAYIIYTLPSEPLSGSSRVVPSAPVIHKKYPFLEYALESWGDHLVGSLQVSEGRTENTVWGDITWTQLSRLVDIFLNQERITTVWIEASWLYERPPVAPQLPDLDFLEYLLAGYPEALRLICEARRSLRELSRDLKKLHESWYHVLMREPNEIWEPSIPAFTKSRFWVSTSKARVVEVPTSHSGPKDFIIVQSRLSQDGTLMGVAKLIPTELWLNGNDLGYIGHSHNKDSDNWAARYEIWSLISNSLIQVVEVSLPDEDMQPYVTLRSLPNTNTTWRKGVEATVSLPLSISDDLYSIVIIDTVISIRRDKPGSEMDSIRSSEAAFDYQALNMIDRGIGKRLPRTRPGEYYYMKFSPSSKYLAVIFEWDQHLCPDLHNLFIGGEVRRAGRYSDRWMLRIFRNDSHDSEQIKGPNYVFLKELKFFPAPQAAFISPQSAIAFHPSAPRLAFAQVLNSLRQTFIWDFEEAFDEGLNPFPVHDPPMIDPVFSADGDYLYGISTDFPSTSSPYDINSGCVSAPRFIQPEQPLITKLPPYVGPRHEPSHTKCLQGRTGQVQSLATIRAAILELAAQPQPLVQRTNALSFGNDDHGVAYISRLWDLKREGAVVLTTLGLDGILRNETLSRLPEEVRRRGDVSIVHGSNAIHGAGDTVRIVVNKSPRQYYSHRDLNKAPPAIVERERDSIPCHVATVNLEVESHEPASALLQLSRGDTGNRDGQASGALLSIPRLDQPESRRDEPRVPLNCYGVEATSSPLDTNAEFTSIPNNPPALPHRIKRKASRTLGPKKREVKARVI
ncbi:hypothetical protein GGR52DRAFT_555997 [Hypoxylon sp. FL1284]|nr:hypothetical protein GGR52DRAFT_555997 [Hypoxylon sp. FL1284]